MAITVYKSSDAGAPILTGEVGKLVDVLDMCLVTGYGSKPGAGWTKPFTGTNKAVFQQGTGGLGYCVRVDDTSASPTTYFRGYVSMSDVDTGTDSFPSTVQQATGCSTFRSDAADTAVKQWIVVATSNYFYLVTDLDDVRKIAMFFGNFNKYYAGDNYNCALTGWGPTDSGYQLNYSDGITGSTVRCPRYAAGPLTGPSPTSTFIKANCNVTSFSTNGVGYHTGYNTVLNYPNPTDGLIYMSPMNVLENNTIRGTLPGIFGVAHNDTNFTHMQQIEGTGVYSTKTFMYIKLAGTFGGFLLEI